MLSNKHDIEADGTEANIPIKRDDDGDRKSSNAGWKSPFIREIRGPVERNKLHRDYWRVNNGSESAWRGDLAMKNVAVATSAVHAPQHKDVRSDLG